MSDLYAAHSGHQITRYVAGELACKVNLNVLSLDTPFGSSSLCLKPYHESSALGSPGRTSMPMTLLSSLNHLRNVSGGS